MDLALSLWMVCSTSIQATRGGAVCPAMSCWPSRSEIPDNVVSAIEGEFPASLAAMLARVPRAIGSELAAATALCQVDVALWHTSEVVRLSARVRYWGQNGLCQTL